MSYAHTEQEVHRGLHLVPEHLRQGLQEYCLVGRPVGQFLTACLTNDLHMAVSFGDDASLAGIKGVMQFLYNYSPGGCWRTKERVNAWMAKGGLRAEMLAEA